MNDIQEGWKCPVCKKIFAPTQKMCKKCSKVESTNNPGDSKDIIMYDDKINKNNLKIISEELIIQYSEDLSNEKRDTYINLLDDAYYFRMVGLSPVFITTSDMKTLFVTSDEKLRNQYH